MIYNWTLNDWNDKRTNSIAVSEADLLSVYSLQPGRQSDHSTRNTAHAFMGLGRSEEAGYDGTSMMDEFNNEKQPMEGKYSNVYGHLKSHEVDTAKTTN